MLSGLGHEASVVLDEFDAADCPYDAMIFPYTYIDTQLAAAIRQYARPGKQAIVELPVEDVDAARAVGKQYGMQVVGHEEPIYWFNGWDLRGTGEEPGAQAGRFAGFGAHERLFGFPLGRTHGTMLHQDLRDFEGGFIGVKVKPDIALREVSDEYRSMVKTRVIETESEGLLCVVNRGLYDHELEVAVKGYEPIKAKVGMYSVTKQLLN